jgi:hypothetical protein
MYVSETALGPLRITPAAEATSARKSAALCDVIANADTTEAAIPPSAIRFSRKMDFKFSAIRFSRKMDFKFEFKP